MKNGRFGIDSFLEIKGELIFSFSYTFFAFFVRFGSYVLCYVSMVARLFSTIGAVETFHGFLSVCQFCAKMITKSSEVAPGASAVGPTNRAGATADKT